MQGYPETMEEQFCCECCYSHIPSRCPRCGACRVKYGYLDEECGKCYQAPRYQEQGFDKEWEDGNFPIDPDPADAEKTDKWRAYWEDRESEMRQKGRPADLQTNEDK